MTKHGGTKPQAATSGQAGNESNLAWPLLQEKAAVLQDSCGELALEIECKGVLALALNVQLQ